LFTQRHFDRYSLEQREHITAGKRVQEKESLEREEEEKNPANFESV